VADPRSGHETEDPPVEGADPVARDVLVVGGGAAGLECARVLAGRGHHVTVAERRERLGGVLRTAAVGAGRERLARFTDWLEAECRRLGVRFETGTAISPDDLDAAIHSGREVVLATGSRPAERRYPPVAPPGAEIADPAGHPGPDAPPEPDRPSAPDSAPAPAGAGGVASSGSTRLIDVLELLDDGVGALPAGPVAVHDPIGGPIGVAVAEWLAAAGREVSLITPDQIAGTLLSLSGDLADANGRLQRAGVRRELRALIREVGDGRATLEDVWTGAGRQIGCAALIDCGHRLPEESLYLARPGTPRAGDCIAPRTVLEAVLDGRRRAVEISARQVPLGADN
jgi:2,4-dienoyl-CoA reductase (NADPH2)